MSCELSSEHPSPRLAQQIVIIMDAQVMQQVVKLVDE